MKLKNLLFSLLLSCLNSSFAAQPDPCLCYCSYKPGPREAASDDTPRIVNTKELQPNTDKVYDICFCKQRDIDKFVDDPTVIKNITQSDVDQLSCCD